MWEVAKRITRERKRREIEPLMHHLNRLKAVDEADPQSLNFVKMIGDIERLVGRMNKTSDTLMKMEENAFFGSIIRLLK